LAKGVKDYILNVCFGLVSIGGLLFLYWKKKTDQSVSTQSLPCTHRFVDLSLGYSPRSSLVDIHIFTQNHYFHKNLISLDYMCSTNEFVPVLH